MGTTKRQRQKEGRLARLEAARAAQQRAQSRRRIVTVIGVVLLFVLVAFAFSALFDEGDEEVATTDTSSTTATTTTGISLTAPEPGASITGETPCPPEDGSAERTTSFEQAPPECIDPDATYVAEVATSEGDFTIDLRPDLAPVAVNNFVVLARYHFFDGIPFHRIVKGFVVQAGDPEATGGGGPGYQFDDELPEDASAYVEGTVAMANSGPDSNGSQFFVVLSDDPGLDPLYSVFGEVSDGMDVVHSIEEAGIEAPSGEPTREVTIESITITEGDAEAG